MYNGVEVIEMSRYIRDTLAERFWPKVDKRGPDDCWEWKGGKIPAGYGIIRGHGKVLKAHRVAWELTNGPIPEGEGWHGTCVLHKCDNPGCVNPAHLRLGPQSENINDMYRKKRDADPHGEANGNSRLVKEQVLGVRALLEEGKLSLRAIAARYDVALRTIWNIKEGITWGWLE